MLLLVTITLIVYIFIYLKEQNNQHIEVNDVLLNSEELMNHGKEIARLHSFKRKEDVKERLLYRLNRNFDDIEEIYLKLNKKVTNKRELPKASEWLLDNFYIIEIQYKRIKKSLEGEKKLKLNVLDNGFLREYPRVYSIALELISHTDGILTEENLMNFVRAYQTESILSIKEISSLSLMLTFALMEHIRNMCKKINEIQEVWEKVDKIDISNFDEIEDYLQRIPEIDSSYVEYLLKRIKKEKEDSSLFIDRLEKRLNYIGTSVRDILEREYRKQASIRISIGNSIISLKSISNFDWYTIFESICVVEKIMRGDPSGIYEKMDQESRGYYRYQVEKLAKKLKTQEIYIAKKAVEYAYDACKNGEIEKKRHIGYYIIDEGRKKIFDDLGYTDRNKGLYLKSPIFYFIPVLFFTFFLTYILGYYAYFYGNLAMGILVGILVLIPASTISISICNLIFSRVFSPTFLPKIEFKDGIPEEKATFIVIPTLLPNEDRVVELARDLETYYLSNREKNLFFAILGDYKDGHHEKSDDDEKISKRALNCIESLNRKYANNEDIFYYFQRHRVYSKSENKWMGWERKRGALVEFNNLLMGDNDTPYFIISGDISKIQGTVKYVITLDADTKLSIDTAKRLIGTISHPLNSPIFNEQKKIVAEGYGIIQPRIIVDIESANQSFFTRVFAGQGGIDPYTTAVSDIYQDLFGEGIFIGKGIYDLEMFQKCLKNSIPENTVLSHDLLEGSYLRVGLATDIELVDGYPAKYSSYMMRLHRWVRGDWQLLRWLFSIRENPISCLSKWKIADNLRRSIEPISLLLLIVLGITFFPGNPYIWLGISLVALFMPIILSVIESFLYKRIKINKLKFNGNLIAGFKGYLYQSLLRFIFLPYEAYMMLDAIFRTIYRMFISKKHLLQWTTAFDMEKKLKNNFRSYLMRMKWSIFISAISIALVVFYSSINSNLAIFICALWFISPYVAYAISKEEMEEIKITEENIKLLRKFSRKTWHYYNTFANKENNFLPPDNFQEFPYNGVANRTSPTNIGFLFIAIISAKDFGYITTTEMIDSIERALSTVEKMEKWKGHLYNWYDTTDLKPLRPYFVSTVDSGNFVAYLIALNEGLKEYLDKPIFGESYIKGFKDTVELIEDQEIRNEYLDHLNSLENINDRELEKIIKKLSNLTEEKKDIWIDNSLNMLKSILGEYQLLFPNSVEYSYLRNNYEGIQKDASLRKLKSYYTDVSQRVDNKNVVEISERLNSNVIKTIYYIENLIHRIDKLIDETEFAPLYDGGKDLFSIGYNVEDNRLLNTYYDLLASEARLTSYIAVSRREVPKKHWFRLGRPLVMKNGYKSLASWTGTMFEYLMPSLVMKNFKNTLLDETYQTAITTQKNYCHKKNVPWGISESGFFAFDINLNYQYRAFGVPFLGFKRGLKEDLVVSPYSTFLSLPFKSNESINNIKELMREELEGEYGFYEAIDYTKRRLPVNINKAIVKSYMTHHQGMIFISINNFLNNNIIIRRFHRNPQMRCGEILLQEKIPLGLLVAKEKENLIEYTIDKDENEINVVRTYDKTSLKDLRCHILSSGNYSMMITNQGLGYSKKENIYINRWRDDILTRKFGSFIYIKNLNNNKIWSATYEPIKAEPDDYKVEFSNDKVTFSRMDDYIQTRTEIVLLSEEYGEIRKVAFKNTSEEDVLLEVMSYFEVVGDQLTSDSAHPVFNNLFIKTEVLQEQESLLAYRKPRSESQKPIWIVHGIKDLNNALSGFQYETNRANFVGRSNNLSNPVGLIKGLTGSAGVVLDPIMSLSKRIKIKAGGNAEVYFFTGVVENRDEAIRFSKKYRDKISFKRAFEIAYTRSQTEIGYLNFTPSQIKFFEELLPRILFFNPENKRRYESIVEKNEKGQEGLWAYGISGDNPIVLITIKTMEGIDTLKEILKAHEYWSFKGITVDLLVLNEDESAYYQPLLENIKEVVFECRGNAIDTNGGVFIRNANSMPPEDRILIYEWARLVINGEEGFVKGKEKINNIPYKKFERNIIEFPSIQKSLDLINYNGYGGFSKDGAEYVIKLSNDLNTPLPWINVIANRDFGFIVSENGTGFTWAHNSRENKLTPWYNDPITDIAGEIIYISDNNSGETWTITPQPIRKSDVYTVTHGLGYTNFYLERSGLEQNLTMFAALEDNIKINLLNIKNNSSFERKLSIYYFIRPVLGVTDEITHNFIETEMNKKEEVFIVRNSTNTEFKGSTIFVGSSETIYSYTGDRKEFIGSSGTLNDPDGVKREKLSSKVGVGLDPCCAIETQITIQSGEEKEISILLGESLVEDDIYKIINKYRKAQDSKKALSEAKKFWKRLLGKIQIKTPDNSMDLLLNKWLMYQTIACRLWARAAFYQVGGAYGARDQMQDVINCIYILPDEARKQIINNCRHQFVEGDVQHWWHPSPYNNVHKGIRTKYSDDLLWLPYAVAEYLVATGDNTILDEKVPYIESPPLGEESERYEVPKLSEESSTVYDHCIRAIEKSLSFGERGIPLMGSGDWNDGMNKVGYKGKGESIWLGWFLATTLKRFIPICESIGETDRAKKYENIVGDIKKAIEKNGWDGEWYRRAYFDDGKPLGSKEGNECIIDSIAQSWSIISGLGSEDRVQKAMDSLSKYLVKEEEGMILLLTPPFDEGELDPGYIKSYVPGVRENGGQYTHAAAWVILAFAMLGDGDKAHKLFNLINPINHTRTPIECANYKVEPYVMAADVYAVPPHIGRGGWTWYTGSSGWMYKVGLEYIIGFRKEGSKLFIDPCIPKDWDKYNIRYEFMETVYNIEVKNPYKVNKGVNYIKLDGNVLEEKYVLLFNDGVEHFVQVVLGSYKDRVQES